MELAPADAIVLRPQELGGQPAPWLAYWAFYLIVIGICARVWTWWRAEEALDDNHSSMPEDEEWEDPWDMNQPKDYLDTYLDWGPAAGVRRRSTRAEEPWRNLLDTMANREEEQEDRTTPTLLDTPSTTRSPALDLASTHRSNSPRSNYSPWRETVRESRDMQWLVTRRLNTKDSWQL